MCKLCFLIFVVAASCCVVGIYCSMFNVPNDFSPHIGKFFIASVAALTGTVVTLTDPYSNKGN